VDQFQLVREHLGANAEAVLAQSQPSVRLTVTGPVDPDSTGSRFGGHALLPPGMSWPHRDGQPLSFLGQIRMDEVGRPGIGLLAFFYDLEEQPWGYDPAHAGGCRVVAVDPGSAVAAPAPAGAEEFAPHGLAPAAGTTLPDLSEPVVAHLFEPDWDVAREYWEAVDEASSGDPVHRMFGWPDLIQNPMQLECQLASNGIYVGRPDGYRDPRVADLRGGAADWRLLLQIDSDDGVGWMWGDVGRIYYWIREEDLNAGRFDRVWLVLQCG